MTSGGKIKLVSSDLNGTLVHQHTMSDMIRLYIGKKQYQLAKEVFEKQISGELSIKEAFQTAGPLTRGLTLREAIEYTRAHMKYLNGFQEFIDSLHKHKISLIINSTGYSVTTHAIREQIGLSNIHGVIGNSLRFGMNAELNKTISEAELQRRVREYFIRSDAVDDPVYDNLKATGVIDLNISDEDAKAKLIREYISKNFGDIHPNEIAHMGDSMGDSMGILEIAKAGGIGIAFNYNNPLKEFLKKALKKQIIKGKIYFIEPKSESSDLTKVLPRLI
jgi:phosphoserine phosphatase